MIATECPPKDVLRSFLSGKLPDEDSATLGEHLSRCCLCEETATQLEREPDTFAELLQIESEAASGSQDDALGDPLNLKLAKRLVEPWESSSALSSPSLTRIEGSVGSYDLEGFLGRGGMGTVYVARHRDLDRRVAIKLLPTLSARRQETVARFRREIRAAGRLDHPAIVRATDAGEVAGTHFLVMELVEGLDVSHIARCVGPLAIADACEIVRQAAIGLDYAHEQGVIHRDIKPSNLMLDENGQVKILDFGLAQLVFGDSTTDELTSAGQLMGTLDYMAPEQGVRGRSVDGRADVYALGATLFRLLSGSPPLDCEDDLPPLQKLRLLSEHKVQQITRLRQDIPTALVELVERMLATDPSQRPSSAACIADALTPYCGGDADLVALLQHSRAKGMAGTSPKTHSPSPLATTSRSTAIPPTRRPDWLRWMAAALIPLLALAAVLITMELTQGQLVIESPDAEVTIQLVDEKQRSQQLEILPGTTATRLRDGKYEITIAAGSDRFALSKNTITIHRGEVEVARILRAGSASKAGDDPSSDQATITYGERNPFASAGEDPFAASSSQGKPFSDGADASNPFGEPFSRRTDNPFGDVTVENQPKAANMFAALDQVIRPNFTGVPLSQVARVLADEFNIPIWINSASLEEIGLTADVPIVLDLPEISLRSMLRLMLDPLGLAYTVRNEVLEITTKEKAEPLQVHPGDTLAIYIENLIPFPDRPGQLPPTPIFQAGMRPPVQGSLFAVNESGEIALPMLSNLQVADRSVGEIRYALEKASAKILRAGATPAIAVNILMRAGESLDVKNLTQPSESTRAPATQAKQN